MDSLVPSVEQTLKHHTCIKVHRWLRYKVDEVYLSVDFILIDLFCMSRDGKIFAGSFGCEEGKKAKWSISGFRKLVWNVNLVCFCTEDAMELNSFRVFNFENIFHWIFLHKARIFKKLFIHICCIQNQLFSCFPHQSCYVYTRQFHLNSCVIYFLRACFKKFYFLIYFCLRSFLI